uniref:Plectrovirus spv1-c74 orf 14 protein n=1 Tax=Spiroplasma citri TaxID=2133 RepID=Q14NB2_SPICI|nr:plectrovirus spv1-c74 orf 14 protein [Spiroplasma citri]
MQTKQYFILQPLVKKYGKDNVINTVNKIAKDIEIKK